MFVWGSFSEYIEQEEEGTASDEEEVYALERSSQHFFVKRIDITEDRTTQASAVRTTRARIQDTFPELDIVRYDPGYQYLDRFCQ